jgi:hypothetical protein
MRGSDLTKVAHPVFADRLSVVLLKDARVAHPVRRPGHGRPLPPTSMLRREAGGDTSNP